MKFFAYIILSISTYASLAIEVNFFEEVWIDGSSLHGSFTHKNLNTLYFSNRDVAINAYLNKDYSIAIQLDPGFDPFPFNNIDLPNIEALASISSNEIVQEYLTFLENFSRTNGVNYLVLPDTIELSSFEKEVVQLASVLSPQFFIQKKLLKYKVPDSKKDFVDLVSNSPQILVASEDHNLKKIKKWSAKFLPEDHQRFLTQLEEAKTEKFGEISDLPSGLHHSIFRSGIYAVDHELNLPIAKKEITYLGKNELLKAWLSKYAFVHTTRKEGILTVVDLLSNQSIGIQTHDIVLTSDQLDLEDVSQLVFPFEMQDQEILIAKMLFGSEEVLGRNESARFIPNMNYIGFSDPIVEGFSRDFQRHLDSIGRSAIARYATPGLQLAVVKNGSIVLEKSMGTYTYDRIKSVDAETMYDIASLTKVMATLPAVGWLLDKDLIELDDSIAHYLPEFIGSNKGKATIRQLLAHNAGLKSYVPFWSMVMEGDRLDAFYYKNQEDEANDIRSYGFEPNPVMLDSLRSYIVKSELIRKPEGYNYSDLGFMILHLLVERVTNRPFDEFLKDEFYDPMGLRRTTFNPIASGFDVKSIAPTEYDQRFRDYLVWGEVHDRNAAVFGGVSGHAGLFSNAQDLAKMMTMLLNGGYYGGKRYISAEVLRLFNKRYFTENRRGLGWDKKDGQFDSASEYASDKSFGHTGFTGTMVWADPEQDLIFVFLSNRIHPDASNNKLGEYNIRTLMHDCIYESVNSINTLKLN